MDLQEVKTCLRALLSSTAFAYNVDNLLSDFKNMTGVDLPLFGCMHPVEFLKTLDDTVQIIGNPFNPEIALIESKKSAHITSLVDRQKTSTLKSKYPHFTGRQKRLILPGKDKVIEDSNQNKSQGRSVRETKTSKVEIAVNKPKETQLVTSLMNGNLSKQPLPKQKLVLVKKGVPGLQKKAGESHVVEKTDGCYFEDNESCFSNGESKSSSGLPTSSHCNFINEGIKNKLKQLIKGYPEGLWCCELPELFLKEFHFILDYREFGYTSLIQMLSELPDVFRCIRPGKEDWILFDASVSLSSEEKKLMDLQSTADTNREVKANLKKLLLNHLKNSSDSGVEISRIPDLYQEKFGKELDLQSLGFKDVKSLLDSWEGSSLHVLKINENIFVVPALKMTSQSPIRWEEAVPPVTAENDIFVEIFPKDVVGPEGKLVELDLYRHVAVGHVVEVCVAEVWSPTKFYLQLNKFKNRLNRFMDDLQRFYNIHLNKYKMPNSTIRPNQVCVGLYSSEPEFPEEWHRAQVVKVINEKTVLINFVDFGTVTRVKKTQLRFLHQSFQYFPVQAFLAELSGISPPNGQEIWPMSTNRKFLDYLRIPYFKAEVVEIDFKKPAMSVILFDPFQKPITSINEKLIEEKLACEKEPVTDDAFLLPESDEEDSKPAETETKSLKSENSACSRGKENLKKKDENLMFEFEDVPDLDKSTEEHKSVKENSQNGDHEGRKIFLECAPPPLKIHQIFNPPSSIETEILSQSTKTTSEFLPLSKPKSLPPGLEHVNVFPSLPQTLFLMNPDNIKKRINVLAMELLVKNASIQQVGMNDPALALKIATEMAEAYLGVDVSNLGFNSLLGPSLLVPPMQMQTGPNVCVSTNETATKPVFDLPDIM